MTAKSPAQKKHLALPLVAGKYYKRIINTRK